MSLIDFSGIVSSWRNQPGNPQSKQITLFVKEKPSFSTSIKAQSVLLTCRSIVVLTLNKISPFDKIACSLPHQANTGCTRCHLCPPPPTLSGRWSQVWDSTQNESTSPKSSISEAKLFHPKLMEFLSKWGGWSWTAMNVLNCHPKIFLPRFVMVQRSLVITFLQFALQFCFSLKKKNNRREVKRLLDRWVIGEGSWPIFACAK